MGKFEKKLESTEIQTGACIYCGQVRQFETSGLCTAERLDEMATERCHCMEAQEERREREAKERAEANIDTLFREAPRMAEYLKHSVPLIQERCIDSVSVKSGKTKASVAMMSDGKIKVTKDVKNKAELKS